MSTSEPLRDLAPDVRLVLLPPRSRRVRNIVPQWEVWLGRQRIGRIEQWSVASSSSTFYRATAVHPETGKFIALESGTDLAERVDKVVAAWREPEKFAHRIY